MIPYVIVNQNTQRLKSNHKKNMDNKKKDVNTMFSELKRELENENDVERLIEMYKIFQSNKFEFLSFYYTSHISRRIVHNSICLEYGDFFFARDCSGEIHPYYYIHGNGYFDSVSEIRENIKEGSFSVTARPFLKSGNFPKNHLWTQYILVSEIVMIVRGYNFKYKGDEKLIFKQLMKSYMDSKDLLIGDKEKPLIINVKA